MKITKLIPILLLYCNMCLAPFMSITEDGDYTIGGDISYSPVATNDTIIDITVSNVILDLGGRVLSQGNLVAGLSGVTVEPNLSNITIRNGTISNITGTGIGVREGCTQVTIDNITTFSCDNRGMNLSGVTSAPITNSFVRNSLIANCCQGSSGDFALTMSFCNQVNVTGCKFYGNTNTANAISVMRLNRTFQGVISNIFMSSNTGAAHLYGFDLADAVQQMTLRSCLVTNSFATATGSTTSGIFLENAVASTDNVFEDCTILHCQPTAATSGLSAINVQNNNNNNVFINCRALSNSAPGPINGINFVNCSLNSLIGCNVSNNSSTGSVLNGVLFTTTSTCQVSNCLIFDNKGSTGANGFSLQSCNSCDLIRCTVENTASSGGIAIGYLLSTPLNCSAQDCIASRNIGSTTTNSFGWQASGTIEGNAIVRNSALGNGGTTGNSWNGTFAANTIDNIALAGATTANVPWVNIGVLG